jgi:hypothetical protein
MVFIAEALFFHRARIVGVCANSNLNLSRCLLSVKLVGLVYYIPIGAVSSLVLHIDQGGVLINPQGRLLFMSASVLRSPSSAHLAINPVALGTGYDECRQDDPIVSS